jgi:energy-coupling factor transport system ATP-binding protein
MDLQENILSLGEACQILEKEKIQINGEKFAKLMEKEIARGARYRENVIEVENLCFTYPEGLEALNGINLVIRRGEFVAFLGQNGSGKTTLAKHFNGLLKPSKGTVKIFGSDIFNWKTREIGKKVGYVFQNPDHQIFAQTVRDEIAYTLKLQDLPMEEIKSRVETTLKRVGLEGVGDEDPFSMTKGKRQCVAVASVLASTPDVLILDEPTTGLDFRELCEMMKLTSELNRQGITTIIITHSMWVAAQYAHRIVIFDSGRIAADDSSRKIFAKEDLLETHHLKPPQIVQ